MEIVQQEFTFPEICNSSFFLWLKAGQEWVVLRNHDFCLVVAIVVELTAGYVNESPVQIKPYVRVQLSISPPRSAMNSPCAGIALISEVRSQKH